MQIDSSVLEQKSLMLVQIMDPEWRYALYLKQTIAFGAGGEPFDALRLMDDQTFELMDSFDLGPDEWIFSLADMTLGGSPPSYYVMGTAYVLENELEPTKVDLPSCPQPPSVLNSSMSLA